MLLESHLLSPPHLPSLPSTPPPLPAPGLRHSALRHYLLAPIPLSLALRPPSLANSRPSHHALPVALLPVRNGHQPVHAQGGSWDPHCNDSVLHPKKELAVPQGCLLL
ncbi:unnamed protein product [Leuciscus chuanchicus]